MRIIRILILAAMLALPVSMITSEQAYAQDGEPEITAPVPAAEAPAEAPKPTEAAKPIEEKKSDETAPASSAPEVAVTQPKWLKAIGMAWKPLLAILLALAIAKVGVSEAGKAFIRAGFTVIDMTYLSYVQPAKDPDNKDVEWNPAEARKRAWQTFKKSAPMLIKLLYVWKGKEWGEAMMHKFANMRAKKNKE
ncbi:hypothetical protein LCGC14_0401700 [marine sediment metagenome]|uniref:Uncharacterized protein n=1 Tax=marine sediment metagenome TaxID=412755 RepID=A0A0F9TEU6_9ZZZZ